MNSTYIALKERLNELKAKARGHSLEEERNAQRIKFHIQEQKVLTLAILRMEVQVQCAHKSMTMEASDKAWAKLK